MITTDIDFPAGLPNPLREGHALAPVQGFRRTQLNNGRARQRTTSMTVPSNGNFDYMFTGGEAAAFMLWYKETLENGKAWFNVDRLTPMGMMRLVCRFTGAYSGPVLVGRDRWKYTCPMEIWEQPLPPAEFKDHLEYLVGASIFDYAMNREWPEE